MTKEERQASIIREQANCSWTNKSSSKIVGSAYNTHHANYQSILNYASEMMDACEGLEPTSALKQAASDHGIKEGANMGAFVNWALNEVYG